MQEISHLIWKILVEYISSRDQESAAHHLVSELIDAGIDEDDLYAMAKGNPILKRAVQEQIEVELRDDDDEDL